MAELFHKLSDNERTLIRRKEMGFIFQAFALMPLLSAWENVELSLRMAGTPRGNGRNASSIAWSSLA